MNITVGRTVDPDSINAQVNFDSTDIDAAFTNQADPDEVLFYELYSPTFHTRPVSEQLGVLQRVAALAEAGRAANIVITGGTTVDK